MQSVMNWGSVSGPKEEIRALQSEVEALTHLAR